MPTRNPESSSVADRTALPQPVRVCLITYCLTAHRHYAVSAKNGRNRIDERCWKNDSMLDETRAVCRAVDQYSLINIIQ